MTETTMNMHFASVLFVREGESYHKRRFNEGRPYWSAALPVVLEKHGILNFDEAEPDVLHNRARLALYDIVLVARLDAGRWDAEAVRAVMNGTSQFLLEGPLPADFLKTHLAVVGHPERPIEASLSSVDSRLHQLSERYGDTPEGAISQSFPVKVDRRPAKFAWQFTDCPITLRQEAAWNQVPWAFAPWRLKEGPSASELWAELVDAKAAHWPAVIRRGNVFATSFELFAYLVYQHTAEPFAVDLYRAPAERSYPIEVFLLTLIDFMAARSGKARVRVLPWPVGVDWVVSIRHDFDRPLAPELARRAMSLHKEFGVRATWYWRVTHHTDTSLQEVASNPDAELALHTERLWTQSNQEIESLERAAGRRFVGASAHGGGESFRFQGAPNVLWLISKGLRYTDLICRRSYHPYHYVALMPDGVVKRTDMVCLPRHISLDTGPREGSEQSDEVIRVVNDFRRVGGFAQIMNHPDLNFAALQHVLRNIPKERVVSWTAAEATEWWHATHDRNNLSLHASGARLNINSATQLDLSGLRIEILEPHGVSREITGASLNSAAIEPSSLSDYPVASSDPQVATEAESGVGADFGMAEHAVKPVPNWHDIESVFHRRIRQYYIAVGADPNSAACLSTTRTNTKLVPARAVMLSRFAQWHAPSDDLVRNKVVLEAGSGFGTLGMYFATIGGAAKVIAIDNRNDLVDIGNAAAQELCAHNRITYIAGDMRDLAQIPSSSIDTAVCNNSLYYIPTRAGVRKALKEFSRVIKPGGRLLIYQANRWRYRDAFTKAPIVHLLPKPLADAVCGFTGWTHSHGRVEFMSPFDLAFRISRAGFRTIGWGAQEHGKRLPFIRALFHQYIYVTALRKP